MCREPCITRELIRERAEELEQNFSAILAEAVLEEILRRMEATGLTETFWLWTGEASSSAQEGLLLEYACLIVQDTKDTRTDQELLAGQADLFKEKVLGDCTDRGVSCEVSQFANQRYVELQVSAEVESMRVPLRIRLYLLRDDRLVPTREVFDEILFPERKITCKRVPPEYLLAKKYVRIIAQLELISYIGEYYEIWSILEHCSVDGRRVRDYVEQLCPQSGIRAKEDRIAVIRSYRDYTYMKKRWKVFLRSIHRKEPAWEQVIERFVCFFEPIWQAIEQDRVFLGDWMPQLNRFL